MRVLTVAPGPAEHGVVRHGLAVAGLVAECGVQVTTSRALDRPRGTHDVTHVHFTDALFGTDIASAAARYVSWAQTAPRPLVVTLHDVPGHDADPERDRRRRHGYRRVVEASDAVVVSAAHEAPGARLAGGVDPVVVPLPVEPLVAPGPRPGWTDRPSVGVLGFLYPGKGHAQAVDVVARIGAGAVRVVALGGVSRGHEGLLIDLQRRAGTLGVELLVTGPLSEPDLHAAALATSVPLAAYRTIGASGSLATWLACGRRPITRAGAHTRELEARWPGALRLYDDTHTDTDTDTDSDEVPGGIEQAVAQALLDPGTTWSTTGPPRPDVARAHLAVYRSVLACA